MEDFVAYNSRWRVSLIVLGAAGFVVLGLWMVGAFGEVPSSRRYSAPFTMAGGWFSVLFFGLCGVAGVKKLFDDSPQLRIRPSGLVVSYWSEDVIPWSAIAEVTTWSYRRQKAIILHLRDPALFPGRGFSAKFAGANRMLTGGDISISLTGTTRTYDDAMSAITRFRGANS